MKTKIVIASILKPVDDVRAYWKLSQSIAKTNKYEVNIIGNSGKKHLSENGIKFYPHTIKRNQFLKRAIVPLQILLKIIRIKPKVFIVCTHELLGVALLAKLITQCKLVYDVQENYYLNITEINPSPTRFIIGKTVRFKEKLANHFIDQYWLAEKCYKQQLHFAQTKSITLENKAYEFPYIPRVFDSIRMIYTGTVSNYGGIELAIEAFLKLKQSQPDTTIEIVGQVHSKEVKVRLFELEKRVDGFSLNISSSPIAYDQILQSLAKANLGLITYQPSIVNQEKVPTKLYEYSRYKLPYLIQEKTKWSQIGKELGGAIHVNFRTLEPSQIISKMRNQESLFPESYPRESTWEHESVKLIESLNGLIRYS